MMKVSILTVASKVSWIPVSCNYGTYHAQLSSVQGLPLPVVRCTFSLKQHLLGMQHQPPLCCFGFCVHGPAPLLPKELTCLAVLRSSGVPVLRRQCSAQLGAGPLPLPMAALYLLPRAGPLCGAAPGPPLPPGGPCARPRPTNVCGASCTGCAAIAAAGTGMAFCLILLGRSAQHNLIDPQQQGRHACHGSCSLDVGLSEPPSAARGGLCMAVSIGA